MRDLTQEELVANYAKSYTNAATDFSDAAEKLFPQAYVKGDLKNGEQSIEEYAEKKYFKNIWGRHKEVGKLNINSQTN